MNKEKRDRQFNASAPFFVVRDLEASVKYYHEALGFNRPGLWGDPPAFAMPSRDGFIFMLYQAEGGTEIPTVRDQGGAWDAYVWVEDADALFAEYKEAGAVIEYEPCIQKDYDMKEFAVRDPDGHVIAFGQHFEA
jgi:catechol 2,3-dioxygenase-like lactoylglutathione lyase family enzyme